MAKAEVTKVFTFDAAHQLPNHHGKCRNLHGHTYRLEVSCFGTVVTDDTASDHGMVVDFDMVKQVWKAWLEPLLDHKFLNETVPVDYHPTTAENLSRFIMDKFQEAADGAFDVVQVVLYETPTSKVRVIQGWT